MWQHVHNCADIHGYRAEYATAIYKAHARAILDKLKTFYSVIKAFESKARFVFVTGVSKFCHVSLFSDLNNLTDISMHRDYATMFGYTQEEFETYFADRIESACRQLKQSEKQLLPEIKQWYDGYRFEEESETVYNPVSLAQFFTNSCKFNNYCTIFRYISSTSCFLTC